MNHSLELFQGEQLLFSSQSHWLYPLFELNDFIKEKSISSQGLYLKDKIAGRAAAGLIVHFGIKRCYIELLSQPGKDLLEREGVDFQFGQLVPRIDCRTEEWIQKDWTIQRIVHFLKKRAGRVQGVPLKIDSLDVSFGDNSVLSNLSLDMPGGDQMVLKGENGSGKTTLLRCILGLQAFNRGSIHIDGNALGTKGGKQISTVLGYLPQQQSQTDMPISAGEVVTLGFGKKAMSSKERDYRREIALRQTGAFHLKDKLWRELSGGEKQRISLARCLYQNAKLLLIDEPTSYLDPKAKESLIELLHQVVQDITPTILLVSHDLDWLKALGWEEKELKEGRLC